MSDLVRQRMDYAVEQHAKIMVENADLRAQLAVAVGAAHELLAATNPLIVEDARKTASARKRLYSVVTTLPARARALMEGVENIKKVRDGYASQAKFADVDPAVYFREFVARIDRALASLTRLDTP